MLYCPLQEQVVLFPIVVQNKSYEQSSYGSGFATSFCLPDIKVSDFWEDDPEPRNRTRLQQVKGQSESYEPRG